MSKVTARRDRFLDLMRAKGLTAAQVAALLNRNPAHVRAWLAGLRPIPENMLRLFELEIEHGRAREYVNAVAQA